MIVVFWNFTLCWFIFEIEVVMIVLFDLKFSFSSNDNLLIFVLLSITDYFSEKKTISFSFWIIYYFLDLGCFFGKEYQNIWTVLSQLTYQSAIISQQSHLNFTYLVKIVEQNKRIERCKNNRNRFKIAAVLRFWKFWIDLIFDLYWIF